MANVATLVVCLMTIIDLSYGQGNTFISSSSGNCVNADGRRPCLLDGWVHFGGKCYYFLTYKLNYYNAKNYCENNGGKLAEPTTRSENEFLKATARQYKTNQWWIGLNDVHSEGTWVWTQSGSPPWYNDWKNGNPNQGRRANCGGLWHQYDYGWVDEPCSRAYNAICEL